MHDDDVPFARWLRGLLAALVVSATHCTPGRSAAPQARPPTAAKSPIAAPTGATMPTTVATTSAGLRPCSHDSPAAKTALAALEALAIKIDVLAVDADARPLAAEIQRLVNEGECFQFLKAEGRDLEFTMGASLKEWWDYGGAAWLVHVLRFDAPDGRRAWIPPTPRRTLSREAEPGHRLASTILCSLRDPACGAETRPWQRRATTFFALFDDLRATKSRYRRPADDESRTCEDEAMAEPDLYQAWRRDVEAGETPHAAFPLGNYRAPREGWLVVYGRRGHYVFCDEVRAYDLATGAAYIAQRCNGPASVEGRVGRVSLDALREAAWMILLADEVRQDVRTGGIGVHIPEDIDIVLPGVATVLDFRSVGHSVSSDQTRLGWNWSLHGVTVDAGELTWPTDYNDGAREHAVNLLDIAEAGFVAGCAPARLPNPRKLIGKPPRESLSGDDPDDYDPDDDDDLYYRVVGRQKALMNALGKLNTVPLCPGIGGR